MRLTSALFIALLLTACASPFQTFESARETCRSQGKQLMYRTATFEPVACLTEQEFTAFQQELQTKHDRAKAARPPYDPAVEAARIQADAMILQGLLYRGNVFQPYVSAPPPDIPPRRQPFNCMAIGDFTTCY